MTEHRGWNSRGYLPHLDAAAVIQHVTLRLHGSLPAPVVARLREAGAGAAYRLAVDEELDRCAGPATLADPDCAAIVEGALRRFDGERYDLLAWCVMPNHVHVLFRQSEGWPLGVIVKSWKSYTGRAINHRLGRQGPLWAADYFDRFVRDEDQLVGAIRYIEANPVKAGLCRQPEHWPFSSATKERGPPGPRSPASRHADLEVRAPFNSQR